MLDKKGTTLLETVVAILILSIVGTIILTGFFNVIHTMSEADKVKQQSNDILSFAEKAKKNNVDNSDTVSSSYSFTKKDFTSFDVQTNISRLKTKGTDAGKVILKALNNTNFLTVQELYPDIMNVPKKIHEDTREKEKEFIELNRNGNFNVQIIKPYYGSIQGKWTAFPNEVLPTEMKNLASAANPFYIKVFYPWEYKNGADANATHNGSIIYLAQTTSAYPIESRDGTISLKVFYDYIDDVWYYTNSNDYILDSDILSLNYESNLPCLYKKLSTGNNLKFKDYADFLNHVKISANGWSVLNTNAKFDGVDSNNIWISIK